MNEKIEITVCVNDIVVIDRIFNTRCSAGSEHFIEKIENAIILVKTGRIKKGSLEK